MVNSKSIGDLLPAIRPHVVHFIATAELELSKKYNVPVKVKLTSTFRDSEYQDMLYAQGRTTEGKKVTNAKGGESYHNFQCAWDIALQVDGAITWDKRYYRDAGEIAKRLGIVWGGDWDGDGVVDKEDWDLCHFQMTGGLNLAALRAGQEIQIG